MTDDIKIDLEDPVTYGQREELAALLGKVSRGSLANITELDRRQANAVLIWLHEQIMHKVQEDMETAARVKQIVEESAWRNSQGVYQIIDSEFES